jgi:6-phosphogluconate dehydrogenase
MMAEPCCDWVGENGAGHFVKMVHNGIEYGDMQMICEVYQIMKDGLGMTNDEMHSASLLSGTMASLTATLSRSPVIFLVIVPNEGEAVVDFILDAAGQKGTGKWTAIAALDEGQPLTLIGEAVFARCLSALKEERVAASSILTGPENTKYKGNKDDFIKDLGQALYASKIVSYAQGYQLMRASAETYGWNLNYGGIALMWRGGCIIRSAFLGKIKEAFDKNPELTNLLVDPFFSDKVKGAQTSLRRVVTTAVELGIPAPSISAALSYYDGYRCARLPANLLQAQRDYFGAHTYERIDKPRGEFFHTNWTGRGGDTSATTYTV